MKKGFKKFIFSTLLACGFLFTVTSCGNETKYRDGDICGEATVEGTNAYSQIRRFYVEQFVYEYTQLLQRQVHVLVVLQLIILDLNQFHVQ